MHLKKRMMCMDKSFLINTARFHRKIRIVGNKVIVMVKSVHFPFLSVPSALKVL